MAVHLVLTEQDRSDLGQVIRTKFPNDFRQVAPTQWLISAEMTAQGVCEFLGASEGQFGRIMVSTVSSYYGWHDRDLWDWLSLKLKRAS